MREDPHGYLSIGLHRNKIRKFFLIHRLVAESFIGLCPKGREVNHIDGDKANNYVCNLEYVTRSENHKHAYKIGLKKVMKGEKHPRSKLSDKDIRKIRKMCEAGRYTQKEISRFFGISSGYVSSLWIGARRC